MLLMKTPPTQALTEYTTAPDTPVANLPLFAKVFVLGNDRAGPKPQVMVGTSAGAMRAETERSRTPKPPVLLFDVYTGDMVCDTTFQLGPSEKGNSFRTES